jgi:hypothetical protein
MSHAVLCQCVFNVFSMCVFNVCAMPMSHTIIGMSHACLHRFSLVPTLYCPACIVCPALPIPSSCLACLGLHRVSCIVLSCLYRISFLLVSASTGCPALPCLYKVSVLLVSAPHRVSCIALPSQSFCLACLGPPQGVLHCLAITKFLSCLSRPPTGCPALPCLHKVPVLLVSAPHRVCSAHAWRSTL